MGRPLQPKLKQRSKTNSYCNITIPLKYGKEASGLIHDDLNKVTIERKPRMGKKTEFIITIEELDDAVAYNEFCGEEKTPERVQEFIDTYRWRADNLKLLVDDNVVYTRTVHNFDHLTYDQMRYKFDNDPRAQVDEDYRRDLHQAMLRKAKEKRLGDGS